MNRVQLLGNVGQTPELTYTPGGTSKCRFSVATNRRWTDDKGVAQTKTTWHWCISWGKLAELCAKNLEKGATVFVEGEIEHRQYGSSGERRSSTEIVARVVQWFSKPSRNDTPQEQASSGFESDDIPF